MSSAMADAAQRSAAASADEPAETTEHDGGNGSLGGVAAEAAATASGTAIQTPGGRSAQSCQAGGQAPEGFVTPEPAKSLSPPPFAAPQLATPAGGTASESPASRPSMLTATSLPQLPTDASESPAPPAPGMQLPPAAPPAGPPVSRIPRPAATGSRIPQPPGRREQQQAAPPGGGALSSPTAKGRCMLHIAASHAEVASSQQRLGSSELPNAAPQVCA